MKHKTKIMIDPPAGWKYGFPKELPRAVAQQGIKINEWLIAEGYPQEEIDACGDHFYCGYWEEPVDEKE